MSCKNAHLPLRKQTNHTITMPESKQCPECQFEANHSQSCSKYKEVGWNESKQTEGWKNTFSKKFTDNVLKNGEGNDMKME